MTALTETLMKIQTGGSFTFSNLSRGELASLSTTVSRINGDFQLRKIDGVDTTLVLDRRRDDANECYHALVTRHKGILPKEGHRYVVPKNPVFGN